MADALVSICDKIRSRQTLSLFGEATARSRTDVRERTVPITDLRATDRIHVSENIEGWGWPTGLDRIASSSRAAATAEHTVLSRSRTRILDRVFESPLAVVQGVTKVRETLSVFSTADVTAQARDSLLIADRAVITSFIVAIIDCMQLSERASVGVEVWAREQVAVSEWTTAWASIAAADAIHSRQKVSVSTWVTARNRTRVREQTNYSTVTRLALAEDVIGSRQKVLAENTGTGTGRGTGRDRILVEESARVISGKGMLACVCDGAEAATTFAHSLHTLGMVDWALGGEVSVAREEATLNEGAALPNRLNLGRLVAKAGEQQALDVLWFSEGAKRETRIDDGVAEREPKLRGEEARFSFGRGGYKHHWSLLATDIMRVEQAHVRVNVSKRRY